jgi:hypothetical protein
VCVCWDRVREREICIYCKCDKHALLIFTFANLATWGVCVCVCVCVWERERVSEWVSEWVMHAYVHVCAHHTHTLYYVFLMSCHPTVSSLHVLHVTWAEKSNCETARCWTPQCMQPVRLPVVGHHKTSNLWNCQLLDIIGCQTYESATCVTPQGMQSVNLLAAGHHRTFHIIINITPLW